MSGKQAGNAGTGAGQPVDDLAEAKRIAARMLATPPKPNEDMKLGKRKPLDDADKGKTKPPIKGREKRR